MSKPSQKTNNRGFTLVELIFATVLIGIMVTLAMQTFIALMRFYTWSRYTQANQAAARQTLDDLTRRISNNVISTTGGVGPDSICVVTNTGGSPKSTLYLLDPAAHRIIERGDYATSGCKVNFLDYPSKPDIYISPANEKISKLTFNITRGSVSAPAQPPYNKVGGVVINLTMLNVLDSKDPITGEVKGCQPAATFCSTATMTTAVQAQNGLK
ncbi:type II secretion system protein [Candidatus Saccharibacteria bacterium]|nr:type II secretion system protein [Candidatus Saccharibacteria bacterium]